MGSDLNFLCSGTGDGMRRRQCRGMGADDVSWADALWSDSSRRRVFSSRGRESAVLTTVGTGNFSEPFESEWGGDGRVIGIALFARRRLRVRPIGFITWLLIFFCVLRFLISCGRAILTNKKSVVGGGLWSCVCDITAVRNDAMQCDACLARIEQIGQGRNFNP